MDKEIVRSKMMNIENNLNEVKAKDKGLGFNDLQFVRKPEDATLILNREQKSKLFNAISILGRRRTQILEGLNFTLNQLKLNNEEETV